MLRKPWRPVSHLHALVAISKVLQVVLLICNVRHILVCATGVDYISEFRFSSGRVEHVCNLCEVTLDTPVSLTEHASSLRHLLRFIVRTVISELSLFVHQQYTYLTSAVTELFSVVI